VLDGGGALISLEPDGARRFTFQFPRRNYVLVALTIATLVVQAREIGGARGSARIARKLNRPLLVVPHAPWSAAGRGGALELAKGGATAIADVADLQSTLRLLAARWRSGTQLELFSKTPKTELAKRALAHLEPEESSVLAALGTDPVHPDRLCDATGLSYRTVSQSLLSLSLDGIVLEGPSGYFRRAPYIDVGMLP
jgi:DNA processing protein